MNKLQKTLCDPKVRQKFEKLNRAQKVIFADALMGKSLLITGSGGVGKSTLIEAIKEAIPYMTLTASTGVAGVRIGGRTIDSIAGFSPNHDVFEMELMSARTAAQLKKIEVLVIDEASMFRIDKFESLDLRLRYVTKKDVPFGGIQVILVFDLMQTSPVVNLRDLDGQLLASRYKSKVFFFQSKVFHEMNFQPHVLDQNMRNVDPEQVRILRNFRMGHQLSEVVHYINDTVRHTTLKDAMQQAQKPFICRTNAQVNNFNAETYARLPGKPTRYFGVFTGDYPQIESDLPIERSIELKLNALVMIMVNNAEAGYANGDVGVITAMSPEAISIRLNRGPLVKVTTHVWEYNSSNQDKATGTYAQLPIRLAYAYTGHKCQGMTIPSGAVIDLNGHNHVGSTYVMCSRTTELKTMELIRPLKISDVNVSTVCKELTMKLSMDAIKRRPQDLANCQAIITSPSDDPAYAAGAREILTSIAEAL